MKNIIYSTLTVLLLLQGCGDDSIKKTNDANISGNGEDLNANPTENNGSVTRGTVETATADDLETFPEARFIDLPIVPTFTRVGVDIVKETKSNLYWQDNEEAKETIKTFSKAEEYCSNLTLNSGDLSLSNWRVPTYKELMTLINYDREQPAIYDEFVYTAREYYWSSTPSARSQSRSTGTSKAWAVGFRYGNTGEGYVDGFVTSNKHVRCVSDEFANKRVLDVNFTRENNIVTDHIHKLEWQDEVETKTALYDFNDAQDYCSALSLNAKTDWKVPSVKELLSIHDVSDFDSASYNQFFYTAYNKPYRTRKPRASLYGWTLKFADGNIRNSGLTSRGSTFDYYVRCVRNSD